MPTTVIVDRTGRVVFSRGGIVRRDDVLSAVHQALTPSNPDAVGGSIYLTFDDFPSLVGGEALLDVLRSVGVKATLFCMGSRMEANRELLLRAAREGHSIQCHSWDHDGRNPQLDRCRRAFDIVLGTRFRLYRAPGSERIVGLEQPPPVVDPYDFSRPGKPEILRRILEAVKPGSEIQLHAGVQETLDALPELVEKLRQRGYSFRTL